MAGGFDPEKDKLLKEWKCEETGLIVSIHQYGDGEPKVQIGPRILKKKMEQTEDQAKQDD